MKTNSTSQRGVHSASIMHRWWFLPALLTGVLLATIGYWWFATHVLLPPEMPAPSNEQVSAEKPQAAALGTPAGETLPPDQKHSLWVTRDSTLAGLRGTFGDMFGALNALFSALAFACVFYALLLQREDLRLQKEELTKTQLVAINATKLQGHATLASITLDTIRQTRPDEELRRELTQQLGHIQRLLDKLEVMEMWERAATEPDSDTPSIGSK